MEARGSCCVPLSYAALYVYKATHSHLPQAMVSRLSPLRGYLALNLVAFPQPLEYLTLLKNRKSPHSNCCCNGLRPTTPWARIGSTIKSFKTASLAASTEVISPFVSVPVIENAIFEAVTKIIALLAADPAAGGDGGSQFVRRTCRGTAENE